MHNPPDAGVCNRTWQLYMLLLTKRKRKAANNGWKKSCLKIFRKTKQSLITASPGKMIVMTIFSNCAGQMDIRVRNVEPHAIGEAHGIFSFAANTNNQLQPKRFFTLPRNLCVAGLRRCGGSLPERQMSTPPISRSCLALAAIKRPGLGFKSFAALLSDSWGKSCRISSRPMRFT